MSPLLFASGMEYLSCILKCVSQDDSFKFHPRCKPIQLTHLCFADDLILFAKGDYTFICIIFQGLEIFADSSGLHVNSSKSTIYLVDINKEQQSDILSRIDLPLGKLPFRYLGVPLNSKSISAFDCEKLVDKMTSKTRG